MNNKTIIFDFDGTIADTLSYTFEIVNQLTVKYGARKVTKREFDQFRHESPLVTIKKFKISIFKIPSLLREGQKMMTKKMTNVHFIVGMKEVLIELKNKGYKLGILTSNSRENIDLFLKHNDLNIFEFVETGINLFGKDKKLKNIIRKYNLNKDEIIYVGDEVRDIEACHKVGIDIIAVTWGFNTREILKKHKPQYLIFSPQQLINLLLFGKYCLI